MGLFDFFTEDIAIDLGTANTLIIHNDKVVVDEPSIVATELRTGKVIAVGAKAQQMHGKAHKGITTNRPLKDGVIADFDAAEQMIKEFIKSIPSLQNRLWTPSLRMVICIPSGITEVEKRAVIDQGNSAIAPTAVGAYVDALQADGLYNRVGIWEYRIKNFEID